MSLPSPAPKERLGEKTTPLKLCWAKAWSKGKKGNECTDLLELLLVGEPEWHSGHASPGSPDEDGGGFAGVGEAEEHEQLIARLPALLDEPVGEGFGLVLELLEGPGEILVLEPESVLVRVAEFSKR